MKKLLFAAMLSISLLSSAFASEANTVNNNAVRSFNAAFSYVNSVQWSVRSGLNVATFNQNNVQTQVFYDYDGTQLATCKNLTFQDLSTRAQQKFSKKFSGYAVKEVISYESKDESYHFISAENEQESLIIKVDRESLWVFEKKARQ